MAAEALRRGADAVIGMKFDNRPITDSWTEICAYGTAVRLVRPSTPNTGPARQATYASQAQAATVRS